MSVRANFADIYLQGMRDRSMASGTELAREFQLTNWSTAGNLSNRSSGVQIPNDICTRFGCYLYSTKCSWITKSRIDPFASFVCQTYDNCNNSYWIGLKKLAPLFHPIRSKSKPIVTRSLVFEFFDWFTVVSVQL